MNMAFRHLPVLRGGLEWRWLGIALLLAAAFLCFVGTAVETWHDGYGWHEHQRIYQLVLLIAATAAFVAAGRLGHGGLPIYLLLAMLLLGAWSSAASEFPEWAFKEWARYVGLAMLALLVGARARDGVSQYFILAVLFLVSALHAYQFFVYYAMAFITGIQNVHPWMLISGFDNPRFFSQFQVMLMPVLAALCATCGNVGRGRLAGVVFLVLLLQWCMAWSIGGRGAWLAVLLVHCALVVFHRPAWRLVAVQFAAALFGLGLYLLLFKVVPSLLDSEQALPSMLRGGLSLRDLLWARAWDAFLANPWLGVGPMHFSTVLNSIAAHPHQAVLQWLSEWGAPATLLALTLGAWGMWQGVVHFRRTDAKPVDLGIWLSVGGALVLAQVDGVFVMPYAETWLAILIGLAIARWSEPVVIGWWQRIGFGVLAVAAICVLGRVLLIEVPDLPQVQEEYRASHSIGWKPRFWLQGFIPM